MSLTVYIDEFIDYPTETYQKILTFSGVNFDVTALLAAIQKVQEEFENDIGQPLLLQHRSHVLHLPDSLAQLAINAMQAKLGSDCAV